MQAEMRSDLTINYCFHLLDYANANEVQFNKKKNIKDINHDCRWRIKIRGTK